MIRTIVMLLAGAALVAGCASEPATKDDAAATTAPAAMNDAQQAYAKVNDTMHMGMASIPADADLAYMQGMLAHHKGAIAMSEVVLEYGKDEKARDLAGRVIKAQTAEMAEIRAWLDARGAAPAPGADMGAMTDHSNHTP